MQHQLKPIDILFNFACELFFNCTLCNKKIKKYKNNKKVFCSKACFNKWTIGKKQSTETIEKRIKNTDQSKKECKRQETMFYRYGSLTYFSNSKTRSNKISKALKGKSHSKEHHKKVIETKKKNNNLNHKEITKEKIAKSLNEYWQNNSIDHPITVSNNSSRRHKTGYYDNIYYRSSYELKFLEICRRNEIKVESAENKKFRIRYLDKNEKYRYYYPDFYLPDYDLIIEIKPSNLLDFENNLIKFDSAANTYSFKVVTEEDLSNEIFLVNEIKL